MNFLCKQSRLKSQSITQHQFFCTACISFLETKERSFQPNNFVQCRCTSDTGMTVLSQIGQKLNFQCISDVGQPHLLRCTAQGCRHALGQGA